MTLLNSDTVLTSTNGDEPHDETEITPDRQPAISIVTTNRRDAMEHITDDLVGKRVVAPDGQEIGKVTAVDSDKAILKGQTGVAAEMESAISDEESDRLTVDANQIESVTDDTIQLSDDF